MKASNGRKGGENETSFKANVDDANRGTGAPADQVNCREQHLHYRILCRPEKQERLHLIQMEVS